MVVDGAEPAGARLAVVLGWQPGSEVPDLDGGAVDLTGVLRSPEAPSGTPGRRRDARDGGHGRPGEPVGRPAVLRLPGGLRRRRRGRPGSSRCPTETASGGFDLQNLSYALEWWVFAGFAVFLWWRLVRDDHLAATAPADPEPEPDPSPIPRPSPPP